MYKLRKVYTLMYEIGYLYTIQGTFEYIAVYDFFSHCCSTPGQRAGLKAAESQQLQGTQVQTEGI
jgi:hypothetical protein